MDPAWQKAWCTLLAVNQELLAMRSKTGGEYIKFTVSQWKTLVNDIKIPHLIGSACALPITHINQLHSLTQSFDLLSEFLKSAEASGLMRASKPRTSEEVQLFNAALQQLAQSGFKQQLAATYRHVAAQVKAANSAAAGTTSAGRGGSGSSSSNSNGSGGADGSWLGQPCCGADLTLNSLMLFAWKLLQPYSLLVIVEAMVPIAPESAPAVTELALAVLQLVYGQLQRQGQEGEGSQGQQQQQQQGSSTQQQQQQQEQEQEHKVQLGAAANKCYHALHCASLHSSILDIEAMRQPWATAAFAVTMITRAYSIILTKMEIPALVPLARSSGGSSSSSGSEKKKGKGKGKKEKKASAAAAAAAAGTDAAAAIACDAADTAAAAAATTAAGSSSRPPRPKKKPSKKPADVASSMAFEAKVVQTAWQVASEFDNQQQQQQMPKMPYATEDLLGFDSTLLTWLAAYRGAGGHDHMIEDITMYSWAAIMGSHYQGDGTAAVQRQRDQRRRAQPQGKHPTLQVVHMHLSGLVLMCVADALETKDSEELKMYSSDYKIATFAVQGASESVVAYVRYMGSSEFRAEMTAAAFPAAALNVVMQDATVTVLEDSMMCRLNRGLPALLAIMAEKVPAIAVDSSASGDAVAASRNAQ